MSSIRYENLRDGLEDVELIRMAQAGATATTLAEITGIVASVITGTEAVNRREDPAVLAAARSKLAAIVLGRHGGDSTVHRRVDSGAAKSDDERLGGPSLAARSRRCNRHLDFSFNYQCWPPPGNTTPGGPDSCFSNISDTFAQQFAQQFVDMNVDSMLLEAVSDGGWATFQSDHAPQWPQLASKRIDWLGEMTAAVRKRGIQPYFYMNVRSSAYLISPGPWGLGHSEWTWEDQNGTGSKDKTEEGGKICYNAPGRIDQLVNLTKELVRRYRPAAVRYDGLYVRCQYRCRLGCILSIWAALLSRQQRYCC